MKGFFKEEEVKNKDADKSWDPSDTDRLLELYLCGMPPSRISIELKRNPKAIKRRLEWYAYNERDCVVLYKPHKRTPRKGKRFTENETKLLKCWKKRGIPIRAQALILQREMREFADKESLHELTEVKKIGTGVDLCMAYRYLYYCKGHSIVSDQAYDELEKEELEFGVGADWLKKSGSDNPEDYPPHIRSLALYLMFKHAKREGG